MLDNARIDRRSGAWDAVVRLADDTGSERHPHRLRLVSLGASPRDLSDAVHALCAVHGHHPSLASQADAHCAYPDACHWLARVAVAFDAERLLLAQLAAAAGPLPSTPGQARSQAALLAQRHALEMLARSDRRGCATGAVAALVSDWLPIREVLAVAATRFGIDWPDTALPDAQAAAADIAFAAAEPAVERAIAFGASQLLAQHRGLWDLLEARASARAG